MKRKSFEDGLVVWSGYVFVRLRPDRRLCPSAPAAALRVLVCAATFCTTRSTRSMWGAPANKARAADDGRTNPCAAAAYFSNGTRSFEAAPNLMQSSQTHLLSSRGAA